MSLALGKTFVYASAALVSTSSLKTRHKEIQQRNRTAPLLLMPNLSRLPQARRLHQHLPGSLAEEPSQNNHGRLLFA